MAISPRKTPCASCPFRRDTPSGVWSAEEYDKLPLYDGTTAEQLEAGAIGTFLCHNSPKTSICSGWAHLADEHTVALRLAPLLDPQIDVQAVIDYKTSVPVFSSGAEAAEHGKRDIEDPSTEARATVQKVYKTRTALGVPVKLEGDDDDARTVGL